MKAVGGSEFMEDELIKDSLSFRWVERMIKRKRVMSPLNETPKRH